MDRNGESIFTCNFWREINEQFFLVHSLINTSDISHFKKKFSYYVNLNCHKLLDKILKQNNRSKLSQYNFINLKQRLSLLLQQRKHHQEPIQNLIDEMIDQICYDQLIEGLQQTEDLIKNMSQKSEQQQQLIYQQENQILTNLHHVIDSKDELSKQIQQLEYQLEQLDNSNSLQQLEQHVQEINNNLLYTYSSQIVKNHSIKLTRSRVRNHQEELKILKDLIILHEDYQVAESIGKAIFNEKNNTITVIFDKYLSQIQIDLNLEHFANLQRLREVPYEFPEQIPGLRSDDVFEMQMCHFCKLMVDVKNLKQCSYNHFQMGLHEYNEDLLTCQRYQINAKSQQQYILDLYSTNYIIENQQIHCKRYFCLKCLKHEFDSYEITQFLWICPLCKGLCTCIRCSRNEIIYKLKRQYLELNGDLEDIYQSSYFEMLVKEKRNLIKNIPIEFNMFKSNLENNEDTVIPKSNLKHKKSITKNMIKRKIKKNDTSLTSKSHKLTHIESSSSSVKIKKSKEIKRRSLYFNSNHNDHSNQQIFIQ
ncbi:unnamed protein product (macronuclear) [Paramecium tetraurelia]|uniref:Zinc-finger domain-containing protein n=1 Tax=Paramecium tetraurelia TaxID=5888 RepID=A0E7U5_PARTE|nr:uncharacterized protein GSPATT00024090001 [Paramecium tetraurelia]CAK91362.1 unnamed protein product [Paramecium tetraurelia]|eukprot:XP_001458759.1 hypothetical protein (macronuclear) [Paramecium tetraurelia strain d4-2]